MSSVKTPFNIKLLDVTNPKIKNLPYVTSLDMYYGATTNFHPEGLYSIEIFGRIGDRKRDQQFAQIYLKTRVIHTIVLKALTRTKTLYAGIIAGTKYAKFDEELKDFVPATPDDGNTGYSFFISRINDLAIQETASDIRSMRKALLERYKGNLTLDRVVVIPAGLRDAERDGNSRVTTHEVNDHYLKLIRASNQILNATDPESPILDNVRRGMQAALDGLFNYFYTMLSGKTGAILSKMFSRTVQFSSRNIITSMIPNRSRLHGPKLTDCNTHIVGLFQQIKCLGPIGTYLLKNGPISRIFNDGSYQTFLFDKETLEPTDVTLSPAIYRRWQSNEGLDKVINSFRIKDSRHKPVEIQGYYAALLYRKDNTFKVITATDYPYLPEDLDKSLLTPLTFAELLYISTSKRLNMYPATITRYPTAGEGSHFVSKSYVKTTNRSEVLYELDDNFNIDTSQEYIEFPIRGVDFFDSLSPHTSRLDGMGGDHDGDMCNYIVSISNEAVKEANDMSMSKNHYLNAKGKLKLSMNTHTTKLMLRCATLRLN